MLSSCSEDSRRAERRGTAEHCCTRSVVTPQGLPCSVHCAHPPCDATPREPTASTKSQAYWTQLPPIHRDAKKPRLALPLTTCSLAGTIAHTGTSPLPARRTHACRHQKHRALHCQNAQRTTERLTIATSELSPCKPSSLCSTTRLRCQDESKPSSLCSAKRLRGQHTSAAAAGNRAGNQLVSASHLAYSNPRRG